MVHDQAKRFIGWTAVALAAAVFLTYASFHLSPWAATWDEVDFTLALDRYDLLAMQPHAPGYPYFILGGKWLESLAASPVQALGLWNLVMTLSSAYPIYALARRWLNQPSSVLAVILVLLLPLNATLAVRAMSEGAALAWLWWSLWSVVRASERLTASRFLIAAACFGFLLGTRLSYAPFGLALVWLWVRGIREAKREGASAFARGASWLGAVIFFQLLWVGGLVVAEGGVSGLYRLTEAFLQGHIDKWGGGIVSNPMPFGERLLVFVGDNLLWTGTYSRSAELLAIGAALFGISIVRNGLGKELSPKRENLYVRSVSTIRQWLDKSPPGILLASSGFAYGIWALLGQNIDKARHAAPVAAMLMLGLVIWALKPINRTKTAWVWNRAAAVTAIVLALAQAAESSHLLSLQVRAKPAVYQLADYLSSHSLPHTTLYTWEEERVLGYAQVPVQLRPIYTYAYFRADLAADSSAKVLLTGKVLEGFLGQKPEIREHARLIAVFRSDERLDPVYGTISLYEWSR